MFTSYRGQLGYAEIAKGPKFKVGDLVKVTGRYINTHWAEKPTIISDVRVWGSAKDGHIYVTKSGGGFEYDDLELIPEKVVEEKVAESKAEFWVYDETMGVDDINGPFSSSQAAIDWVKLNIDEAASNDQVRILLTYKVLIANPIVEWNEK